MVEPINFNKARKARAQADAKAQAAANRARFGRTKAERAAEDLQRKTARKLLDGAKRDGPNE